jgi:hypothetical protein
MCFSREPTCVAISNGGMQRDAGIAATSPNAAVQHCRAENASPCEDSCAFCYATLGPLTPVLCPVFTFSKSPKWVYNVNVLGH